MSSRVQKGGQRFRPVVVKARPRQADSSSRQLSTVPESQVADSSTPDAAIQATSLPAEAREFTVHQTVNRASEEALRPIDGALNQITSASRADTSESAGTVPQKRNAPKVITVGGSRAPLNVTPVQGAPTGAVVSNNRTSPPELHLASASSHPPVIAPAPPRITTATPSLPEVSSVDQEQMESLLSILQNFSGANNGDSSATGAPYMPEPQMMQQEGSQPTDTLHNANSQLPSVGADPYGTLSLELRNKATHQSDGNDEHARAEVSETSVRRSRSKKSKENVAGPSAGEQSTSGETSRKKRRRAKSKGATQDQSNVEELQEPNKRVRRSGRRKASRQESTTEIQSDAASQNDDVSGADVGESSSKRKTRKSSKRRRGPRAPSLPPIDLDADPGEDLDPTAVTMAAICNDTGQGRVSSKAAVIQKNFALWKQQNREKRARMHAIMEAKKYGREEDELDEGGPSETIDIDGAESEGVGPSSAPAAAVVDKTIPDASDSENQDDNENGFDYSQAVSTSAFNVQVRIGANGETIIDEESLLVDRGRDAEAETEEYTHIEESDQTKFVNSLSYAKKTRGSRWSKEETELFYDALQQFGENYELISLVLPGRDRKSCKNKFKAEDKKNPGRITECLKIRTPYDIQTLSRLTGKDFSGPTPEIRIPEIPRMGSPDEDDTITNGPSENTAAGPAAKPSRRRSRTPRVADDGVEVVGDVDSFVDVDDGVNGT